MCSAAFTFRPICRRPGVTAQETRFQDSPGHLSQRTTRAGVPSVFVGASEGGPRRRRAPTPAAEYLLYGEQGRPPEVELQLRYAELALHSGEAGEARRRFQELLDSRGSTLTAEQRTAARWGVARADEALGELEQAIQGYQELYDETLKQRGWDGVVTYAIALCRSYRAGTTT
jgi:tetratricopeptide (TPR) repeat protein